MNILPSFAGLALIALTIGAVAAGEESMQTVPLGGVPLPARRQPPPSAVTPGTAAAAIPSLRTADQGPPVTHAEPTGPGSEAILRACWTPQQLAGDPDARRIRRHLKPDRTPPPDWAIGAAERALPPLVAALQGSVRGVETTDPKARLVALTFDLCEQANERAGYDATLVNALRAAGVKATFFAGGKWLRTHPEQAMQLMADPLFEIGNHTWTHGNLRLIDGEVARDQILWTQAEYQVLRRALGERPCAVGAGPDAWNQIPAWPTLFRFPFGVCSQGSLDAVAGLGLIAIQWNLVTGDPDKSRSAQAIARAVLDGVKPGRGTIVVGHANGRGWHTAESLPLFIPQLREKGYRFVTVSELLAAGRPLAAESCYEVRPGDNARYDTLFGREAGQ